jgi:hypothetical protein
MRCLYCGNELALFKKLTGGSEFCSEAHRQKYQEEYNKLALSRLLQSQPQAPQNSANSLEPIVAPLPTRETKDHKQPRHEPVASARAIEERLRQAEPQIRERPVIMRRLDSGKEPLRLPEPARSESAPLATYRPEASRPEVSRDQWRPPIFRKPEAPPEPPKEERKEPPREEAPANPAGYLVQRPQPVSSRAASPVGPETAWSRKATVELPQVAAAGAGLTLSIASQVAIDLSATPANGAIASQHLAAQQHEFTHPDPRAELQQEARSSSGWSIANDPMEVLIFPKPPQACGLWVERETKFAPRKTEFSGWLRLDFQTTGFEESTGMTLAHIPVPPPTPMAKMNAPFPAARSKPSTEDLNRLSQSVSAEQPGDSAPVAPASRFVPDPIPATEQKPIEPPPAITHEPEPPPQSTQPLPFTLLAIPAAKAKPLPPHSDAIVVPFRIQQPRLTALPLRPLITLGPPAVEKTPAKATEKPQPAPKPELPKAELSKADLRRAKQRRPEVVVKAEVKSEVVKAEVVKPETAPKEQSRVEASKPEAVVEKQPEARASKPEAKPEIKASPEPASDFGKLEVPTLGLTPEQGAWSRLPKGARIGAIAAVLGIIGLLVYWISGSSGGPAPAAVPRWKEAGPALQVAEGGWTTDWAAEAPGARRQRQVSVFRPSLTLTDYKLEFTGMIEAKALGWVVRAKDPKNFYVMKLEIVKPGLTPTVALARFAVINGEEQPRAQFPLPIKTRLDTLYKVRVDVTSSKFTTFVQDQKVDEWQEDQIKTGGVGLYNERGERAQIRLVKVTPLALTR